MPPTRTSPGADRFLSRAGSVVLALAVGIAATTIREAAGRQSSGHRAAAPSARTSAPPPTGRPTSERTRVADEGLVDVLKRVYAKIGSDRIQAVAAGVTFYGLLSLFPAVAAFVSLFGLVADPVTINDRLAEMSGMLPGGAIDIIGDQVTRLTEGGRGALGLAFFTGLGMSLWSANAGMKAVFDALNIAYGEREKRNFVVLNLWSLAFTVGAVLFLIAMVGVIVVIPIVLRFVGLGPLGEWLLWAGRWPGLLLVILFGLSVLYRFGPSRPGARWHWFTAGNVVAALGCLAFSMLFSWYVASFGSYNKTYGSLGAAIGFMTWMWLSATIILVGAVINQERSRYVRDAGRPA